MNKKTLIDTNPYLRTYEDRIRLVARSVRTSCGVEGIRSHSEEKKFFNVPSRGIKKIFLTKR